MGVGARRAIRSSVRWLGYSRRRNKRAARATRRCRAPIRIDTMPELPEVETTRRGVAPHVGRPAHRRGSRLRPAIALAGSRRPRRARSSAARSTRVDRRSKYLLFRARRRHAARPPRHDRQPARLPQRAAAPAARPRRPRARRRRRRCATTTRAASARCCGSPAPPATHPLLARLGPEPFDAGVRRRLPVARRRAAARAAIKLALMDNHVVVGVGNIYANEALFRAGIRPTTPAGRRVARAARAARRRGARRRSTEAIAKGGSTLRDYVDADGEPGYFQLDYYVYGREGEPCRVCGTRDPAAPPGAARDVLLPALPALMRRRSDADRRLPARTRPRACRSPSVRAYPRSGMTCA